LRTEFAHQLQALQETVSTQISAMNAKRAVLPARVRHLETAVLAPGRAARKAARQRRVRLR
jgi:hypothetical protein